MWSATTCVPSTGERLPGAPTSWSGPGGRSATGEWSSSSTPDERPPVASESTRRPPTPAAGPGWTGPWTRLCCWRHSRAGDHVDFLAHDRTTQTGVFGASRTELLGRLVEAMAPLNPALIESDATAMVSAIMRRTRRRALVVLMTDLNASALDEGLLPVLPQLSARHHVIVAAVTDPRIDQLAAGRSDAAGVYDAAAAERSRNERWAIASRLRHNGVEVVDALPTELAPALADRYLAMKATGRL
jgi:hypothetical protein